MCPFDFLVVVSVLVFVYLFICLFVDVFICLFFLFACLLFLNKQEWSRSIHAVLLCPCLFTNLFPRDFVSVLAAVFKVNQRAPVVVPSNILVCRVFSFSRIMATKWKAVLSCACLVYSPPTHL